MTQFTVNTQTFGEGGLFPRRRVSIGNKTLDTPAKAINVSRLTQSKEELAADSRGAVELYTQVSRTTLREARRDPEKSILDQLEPEAADPEEVVFPFLSYQDGHEIDRPEATQMVDIVAAAGDVVPVPLQPELLSGIEPEDGIDDPGYRAYRSGIELVLQAVEDHEDDLEVMGVLPILGAAYIQDLLELYTAFEIRAFCLNFNRTRITAGKRLQVMQPLARKIVQRGLEEDVVTYGINLNPKEVEVVSGRYPAANFASLGLGIDVVGENHVSPSLPPEVFQEGEDEAATFRLFNRHELTFDDIPKAELEAHWPEETGFDVQRAVTRMESGQWNRLQSLVNAEQLALAAKDLQDAVEGESTTEYLRSKDGVTEKVARALEQVRSTFDDSRDQSSLSEF